MNHLIFIVLVAVCAIANAQDSKATRALRIAAAIGLEESLLDQQKQMVASARKQVNAATTEMEKLGVPAAAITKLTPEMENLVDRIGASWEPKEAARIFSEAYADALTDEDIAEAEKYYSTPKGKTAYAAMKSAQALMNNYILVASNTAMQQGLFEMIQKAKAAAAQARTVTLNTPDTKAQSNGAASMSSICPKQFAPEMPRQAILEGSTGVVRAQAQIKDGVVSDVSILSGPRVFHDAVRDAMLKYECVKTSGTATATQEFKFNLVQKAK